MPPLELIPFGDEHLEAAATLLAERHARHRAAEPLLPVAYEEQDAAKAEIEALRNAEGTTGIVAVRDGRAVGYLLGSRREDDVWGPNAWVELAGHAVQDAEVARDLYAGAAAGWVGEGRTMHYALVPASDRALVEAWFRVGFGQQHAYGIREVPAETESHPEVREAVAADVDALVALAPVLNDHQALSPVFSGGKAFTEAELRADLEEDIARDDVGNLLVQADGRVVASFVLAPIELSSSHSGLSRPEGACLLAWAASRPDVRGSGSGLALMQASLAWARAHGHDVMVADWRVTNLLSSRFWPRRGFRETFVRLHRAVVSE